MTLALDHLDDFGAIESCSGYFHPTSPAGTRSLAIGSSVRDGRANAHAFVSTPKRDPRKRRAFLAFFVRHEHRRFRDANLLLDRELTEAHVPHVFAVHPGAHERTVWPARARTWLQLADDHVAAISR